MYKVLYINQHNMSGLEALLNDAALDGYHWVGMMQSTSNFVIIMEQASRSGSEFGPPGVPHVKRSHHKKKVDVEEPILGA